MHFGKSFCITFLILVFICVYVCVCRFPWWPEEDVGSLGAIIKGDHE